MTETERQKQPWKTEADLEWLKRSSRTIGTGSFGIVYYARIKFKGEKPKRVLVKEFHEHRQPENEADASHYNTAIEKLHNAGVNIPKTRVIRHDGKWVQVSELFGNATRGSKIIPWEHEINTERAEAFFNHIAKIYNAGYAPSDDSIGFVPNASGGKFITHDFDHFAQMEWMLTNELKLVMAKRSTHYVLSQLHIITGISESEAITRLLTKVKHPKMLEVLRELKDEHASKRS